MYISTAPDQAINIVSAQDNQLTAKAWPTGKTAQKDLQRNRDDGHMPKQNTETNFLHLVRNVTKTVRDLLLAR